MNKFADAVPGYVDDLTKGSGRFGFLETKYHVVEKVREQIDKRRREASCSGCPARRVSVTKGVVNIVVGTITIIFLTFFMLLEGPAWVERFYGAPPAGVAAALAQGRARHLPHGRRLRDGQPR